MWIKTLLSCLMVALLMGCSTSPPSNPENLCEIFREKDDWYDAAVDMNEKWGVPIQVPMAMMYQESSFRHNAKPPRDYLLGFIPWGRVSSAYGYSQAKTATWNDYVRETGNSWADRDDFDDAVDFVSWYGSVSHRKLGISQWDAYNQYLAYHEGHGGYTRKTYNGKPWLIDVAKKVSARASEYHTQLSRCEDDLDDGWSLWPF